MTDKSRNMGSEFINERVFSFWSTSPSKTTSSSNYQVASNTIICYFVFLFETMDEIDITRNDLFTFFVVEYHGILIRVSKMYKNFVFSVSVDGC